MGKHSKHSKSKKINFNFIVFILIILIIIGIVALIYKSKREGVNKFSSKNIDDTIVISYINRNNTKIIIKENQAVNEHITVISNKGTIYIKGEKDKTYKKYNEQALEDGKYIVIVETEEGVSKENQIIIDTKAATIKNVDNGEIYSVGQAMTITDENGIASINLELGDGTKIPVLTDENGATKTITYTFEQKGDYELIVIDIAGNKTKLIAFTIE